MRFPQTIHTPFAAACILLTACSTAAEPTLYSCPAFVDVTESVVAAPSGWEGRDQDDPRRHPLAAVSMFDGHPKDLADLKPENGDEPAVPGKPYVQTYRFEGAYPDGVWLGCRYQDTSAILFQRLAKTPKTCQVTYAPEGSGQSVQSISCT